MDRMININTLIDNGLKSIEDISTGDKETEGLKTGFEKLDSVIKGFQVSELTVIGSRTAMGKTALAISIAKNMAVDHKIPIGFISLQTPKEKLIRKLISQESNIPYLNLTTGYIEREEWENLHLSSKNIKESPLYIEDSGRMIIGDLVKKCEDLVKNNNVKCILIDLLQLIDPTPSAYNLGNREQEISMITRVLKQTALALKISIVLFSQLSRAIESRGGSKRPILSDLRDSGTIEEHADTVIFIFKPQYYNIDEWDDDESSPCKDQAELVIAKHNNGPLERIRVFVDPITGKFSTIDEFEPFDFVDKFIEGNDDLEDTPF